MKLPTGSLNRLLVWMLALALPAAALVACGGGSDPAPPLPPLTRMVTLSGAQETALVASPASGSGTLTVDQTTRVVTGSISFFGLTSATAAHIHTAGLGSDGPVLVGLTLAGVALMLWTLNPNLAWPAAWPLLVVPLVPTGAALACLIAAQARSERAAFADVRSQATADMAMLREVAAL